MPDGTSEDPIVGALPPKWIHGAPSARRGTDPPIQVHAYDPSTFILRQSKAVSFEAPFMYLLLGEERALILDTGATADPGRFPLRRYVERLLDGWLAAHPRDPYPLVVAHTHAHGDHVAGDAQFADRPHTTVVDRDVDAVRRFFELDAGPGQVSVFDLGGRRLEVTPCPGHHPTSIAIYDPRSGFLLTGDTVYPGRLYARQFDDFLASLDHLVEFARARKVTHVMGGHIEMTRTPRRDYPFAATYQPDETPLEMTVDQLATIREAARSIAERPGVHKFDDFLIFNGPCMRAIPGMLLRSYAYRARNAVAGMLDR